MKPKKVFYISALLTTVVIVVLWSTGLFGLWTDGMAHIAYNTKDFTDQSGHLIEGDYSVEVDLSNFESNIGREIYSDGDHRIYLLWLQQTQDGGYDVEFRSSGQYSLSKATLVSGLKHETISNHSFTTSTSAKMTAEYKGKIYEGKSTGQCGLNYKDGDCFLFTFFLKDQSNEEPIVDTGMVKLTITDLYKNIWSKR